MAERTKRRGWRRDLTRPIELPALAPGTRIRRVDSDDAPRIDSLCRSGPVRIDERASLVADTDAGELVGVILIGENARIEAVAVAEAWRGRGAASALVARGLELLRRRSQPSATIWLADPISPVQRRLLERFDFEPLAPGYDPQVIDRA